MPSRLRWRAVRHLVRWHRRFPDAPDVRTVAVATALVMAFVAVPETGSVPRAPSVSSTAVAPSTASDRSTANLEASVLGVRSDVRWRVVKPARPAPSAAPATVTPDCVEAAAALAQAGADSASHAELAALQAYAEPRQVTLTLDAECPMLASPTSWYLNAQTMAIAERDAARAAARRQARAEAARAEAARAERRARLERQAAARKAAAERRRQLLARRRVPTPLPSVSCPGWRSNTTPPPTIRVFRSHLKRIDVVPFRLYVERVMASGAWPAYKPMESLKVGAVAVKQYGWYDVMHHLPGHSFRGRCYDVRDGGGDQYYRSDVSIHSKIKAAVAATWNITLRKKGWFFRPGWTAGGGRCGSAVDGWHLPEDSVTACARKGWGFQRILETYLNPRLRIVAS